MPSIEVIVGTNPHLSSEFIDGLSSFARTQHNWSFHIETLVTPNYAHRRILPDGVIVVHHYDLFSKIRPKLPLVSVFRYLPGCPCAVVAPDEHKIGQAAADHFADSGVRDVAFFGVDLPFSQQRRSGFLQRARQRGLIPHTRQFSTRSSHDWPRANDPTLAALELRNIPSPLAVFTANDELASCIINAAQLCNLNVPEDVIVLGVDNNRLFCQYQQIPISSVDVDGRAIGFHAGQQMLHQLQNRVRRHTTLVPPRGVVVRPSSDHLALGDTEVANALGIIRQHAREGLTVHDLLLRVHLSRSWLDRKLKSAIGRTATREIERLRLEHARSLLTETSLPLTEIASATGFNYLSHFSHAFRRHHGQSPRAYRNTHPR